MVLARQFLIDHPEACKIKASRPTLGHLGQREKQADTQHEHGSARCIVAFLGDKNWRVINLDNYRATAWSTARISGRSSAKPYSRVC